MADYLDGKHVLIVGFARQGQALARWLPTVGGRVSVTDSRVADELNIEQNDYPGVEFTLGRHPESLLDGVDLICVSGGVPLDIPLLKAAQKADIRLTNDAQLFLERSPAPVIGITGSAGKTTTTTLVGEILKNAGYKTWVGGNTGTVLLDVLADITPDDVVVMELSSFQLELMTISPQVGAILNITPNHLDRHKTMENYRNAKANIIRYQRERDIAVLCEDDRETMRLEPLVMGELVTFSAMQMVANGTFMAGSRLVLAGAASYDYRPHLLLEKDEIPLRGDHNVANVLAACAIAGALGLAIDRPGIEPQVMHDTIVAFEAVPHRLEMVRDVDGICYFNDSIATAPERVVAALHSFDEPVVLLIGGADKDLPWEKAISLALRKARHVVVFGKPGKKQVRSKVVRLLRLMGASNDVMSEVDTLDEAITRATEVAQAGDVVLLSPGGTSYDAYPDFAARGEHFRQLVKAL